VKVNLVILNYNAKPLLERFLPSCTRAAAQSRHACSVTVLDNCSDDGSVELVKSAFPDVRVVPAKENKVLCSYNEFAASVDDDILILLNNDIEAEIDFVDPLVSVFEKYEDAFFVSTYGDRSVARVRLGTLSADISYPDYEKRIQEFGITLNTGMGAFHRLRYLELGGYDEIYLPGRYEDVDLCYRGWKRGWKGYYEPKSRLHHLGGASFNKYFDKNQNERLVFRNSIFFMIKNITDPGAALSFWCLIFPRVVFFALRGRWHMVGGFCEAMRRLPEAWRARQKAMRHFFVSDAAIVRKVSQDAS